MVWFERYENETKKNGGHKENIWVKQECRSELILYKTQCKENFDTEKLVGGGGRGLQNDKSLLDITMALENHKQARMPET